MEPSPEAQRVYTYRVSFLTQWRMARALTGTQGRWPMVVIALCASLLVRVWSGQPFFPALPWESTGLRASVLALVTMVPLILLFYAATPWALTFFTTAIARLLQGLANAQYSVTASPDGLRFVAPGQDITVAWHAIHEVRLTRHAVLIRTSQWVPIPREALGPAGESQRFCDELESRRGLSETTQLRSADAARSDNPYAAPTQEAGPARPASTELPPRPPDSIVRVISPASSMGTLGGVWRMFRYRPRWFAPLLVTFAFPIMMGGVTGFFASMVVVPVLVLLTQWRHAARRRAALHGVPMVKDFGPAGLEQWSVVGRMGCSWDELIRAVEEESGFVFYSRTVLFHVRKQDLAPDDLPRLRLLLREKLGARATIDL